MCDDLESARPLDGEIEIDVAEACPLWRRDIVDVGARCETAARAALSGAGASFAGGAELSIVLGDDAMICALNRRWRNQDKPTNVLSFASGGATPPGAPHLLGDVVLAYETIASEASAQGKPMADHLCHLVVHGVLHLLGLDHEQPIEAERMEALETAILAGMGIADPYKASDRAPLPETLHG